MLPVFSLIRGPEQLQYSGAPCPSWWSSPLFWPLPPYFYSHTVQTFQRERPFPLSKTEAPFYLGLVVPSLCPNKILGMRLTHGQRTHINPHEKTSLVNCSLSPYPLSVLQFLINAWCHASGQVKWINCCHIAATRKIISCVLWSLRKHLGWKYQASSAECTQGQRG